ncbi:MAG: tripartite tricarboxylate transporter substrate binding protein [Pseudomonadota bacterium]
MNHSRMSRRTVLAFASLLTAVGASAQTGDWPTRQPVRLIVPGPAGGSMDIFARLIQVPLQNALNQTIVMDYKPGANSIIGIDAVAKAAPDGYTIVIAPSSAIAINPVIQAKMPFDVNKDLVPVAQLGAAGILLMTNPNSGFKNLQDMVAYARAHPGKLAYGSWGSGSTGHLVMEGLKAHYGLDMPHVPYKSTAQEIVDLMANNISVAFTDIASPIPHIRSGKLVAMGVTGSARGPALPELPTLTEQGFKFDSDGWFGIFAPAGTPPAIVARLNQEIGKVVATDDTRKKFALQNMAVPPHKSAVQFAATVKSDIELWQPLAKKANLKID